MLAILVIYFIAIFGVHGPVNCYTVEANFENSEDYFNNDIDTFWSNGVELRTMDENPDYDESDLQRMQIIYPGTKWCGTGNIASNDEDFGFFERPDRCCYEHDHCPEYMDPGVTKYELTNDAFFSRMQCDCEQKFYNCLKSVNTFVANQIGFAYFNAITKVCYKEDYPIIKCHQHSTFLQKRCSVYELDTTKPKVWQWFDSPRY